MKVAVIDYQAGNLRSVENAFRKIGAEVVVTSTDAKAISSADAVVLPGVGSFSQMKELASLEDAIRNAAKEKPFLGICLGMQLLFEGSAESKDKGFGVLSGKLARIKAPKVPHIGWNTLEFTSAGKKSPLFAGLKDNDYFYFDHSFAVKKSDAAIGMTEYGEKFVSAVGKGNLFGLQFHPEKSGESGLSILRNFLSLCKR